MPNWFSVGGKTMTDARFYGVLAITYLYGFDCNYHFSPDQAEEVSLVASELRRGLLLCAKSYTTYSDLHLNSAGLSANYLSSSKSDVKNMLVSYHTIAAKSHLYQNTDAYFYIRGAISSMNSDDYPLPLWLVDWYEL